MRVDIILRQNELNINGYISTSIWDILPFRFQIVPKSVYYQNLMVKLFPLFTNILRKTSILVARWYF